MKTLTTTEVLKATGISKELLYAWETRYGAITSSSGLTGRRQYQPCAVRRIRLLQKAVASGRRIGSIARLSDNELLGILYAQICPQLPEFLRLLKDVAYIAFEQQIAGSFRKLGLLDFITKVALPLMVEVGECWEAGELSIASEHFATAKIRSFISAGLQRTEHKEGAPIGVFATLQGELHEVGALSAAIVASQAGWISIYLGPNIPNREIAGVVETSGATLVSIGAMSPDRKTLQPLLDNLADLVAGKAVICVGGTAARHIKAGGQVVAVRSMEEFSDVLADMADGGKTFVTQA